MVFTKNQEFASTQAGSFRMNLHQVKSCGVNPLNQEKQMKVMICLILDRSGSMGGRENDVVNGVNSFIEEQKKLPDPVWLSM